MYAKSNPCHFSIPDPSILDRIRYLRFLRWNRCFIAAYIPHHVTNYVTNGIEKESKKRTKKC